jgi:Fe-Mn family superoxide dismutase
MYTTKDFSHLLGLDGFSDTMLNNHFTLYGGYVTNANKLIEKLDNQNIEKGSIEYNELKRRLGWEVNGIKLHELYFENMQNKTGDQKVNASIDKNENIKSILTENYMSTDEWQASLKRNGMIRGIGWVLLIQDNDTKKVFHTWVGEHNVGNIINAKILMVMDCWEHAYMTDYGIKRADYIEAFIDSIDWSVVESRLA